MEQNQERLIDHLCDLARLDIDAVLAYEQAIKNIDVEAIRKKIAEFQGDHHRHIKNISDHIKELGGVPPNFEPDMKGYLIEGFTFLRSQTGTEGALNAMKTNEKLTNKVYHEALAWDLPPNIRELIESNYQDEQRHLRYIEEALETKLWKQAS